MPQRPGGSSGGASVTKLSVIGCGYLGMVHAACMADLGHEVVGVEVDADKVDLLAAGKAPFHEPGLDDLLGRAVASGRLTFTTDPAAIADSQVYFICVGTPQQTGRYAADLTQVSSAVEALVQHLKPSPDGPVVVVGKSTVPVGTAEGIAERLRIGVPEARATLVWNPEFLREGFAIQDTLSPDRIVYGLPRGSDQAGRRQRVRSLVSCSTTSTTTRSSVSRSRSSSRTTRLRSWSRSPRTRSWPPRSPSSTRWPSCARRPGET
jgi:nucleotide sugar dehydrogenase